MEASLPFCDNSTVEYKKYKKIYSKSILKDKNNIMDNKFRYFAFGIEETMV